MSEVEDRYFAYVLRDDPGAYPRLVDLENAGLIDALVAEWRASMSGSATGLRSLTSASGAGATRGLEDYFAIAEQLREFLWDPLVGLVGDRRTVFIVPDGAVSLVNFSAFPAQQEFLIEKGYRFHYLSAERDLLSAPSDEVGGSFLAVGDPDYTRTTAVMASGRPAGMDEATRPQEPTLAWEPLPGTAIEVQRVAQIVARSFGDSAGRVTSPDPATCAIPAESQGVLVLSKHCATEDAVTALAPGRRILHLATHGFFFDAVEQGRASGLRNIGGRALENPLVLSGVVLAGASAGKAARFEGGGGDGLLTAREVAVMDLAGVEWVVLSACETGIGVAEAGEGVFGLRRAFQQAGARTVVMSLWSVDDQDALQWMTELYRERFAAGVPRSEPTKTSTMEAVHRASRKVLSERRARGASIHPYHWAGFVAAGDWR